MRRKHVLLAVLFISYSISSNAQSFRVGLTGGFNSTWLLNKWVSDQGDELDYKASFGGKIGMDALYNFNEKVGLSLGIIYTGINQEYNTDNKSSTAELKTKLRYIDLPLLFRISSAAGPYFEIGPSFSFMSSAKSDYFTGNETDVKEATNKNTVNGVIAFGADIEASEKIIITIGLRLAYSFSDAYKSNITEFFFDNEATHAAYGGLHLGVAYKISGE